MPDIRQIVLFDRETRTEAGAPVSPPTRQVAVAAVFANPYAGKGPANAAALEALAALSFDIGTELTARALRQFPPGETPTAYSKAVIVGLNGDREHGAAMIHMRIGLAMRRGLGAGPALIPGTKKVAGPGASIDLIFGGATDGWDYDAMDAMEISVPGAPMPDEILLAVAFASGGRPNARIAGASPDQVADLMREIQAKR